MAGQVKKMIDTIIQQRSQGNPAIASSTRIKLAIKGIDPKNFTETSTDDPVVLGKLQQLAQELSIKL